MAKMTRGERAKQFLPFNALKGYYELISEKEKIKEDKKIMMDDEIEELEFYLHQVKKGDFVKIKYYYIDSYKTIEGLVSKIDDLNKTIVIVKTLIKIEDIYSIECEKFKSFY